MPPTFASLNTATFAHSDNPTNKDEFKKKLIRLSTHHPLSADQVSSS